MTDGGNDHIEFLGSFEALDDTLQQAKVLYPLREILLLCLCAVLGGADSWVEVALYGQQGPGRWVEVALYGQHKLGFLRRLLPFAHGVPSHDQLGNVFARLDDGPCWRLHQPPGTSCRRSLQRSAYRSACASLS